MTKSSGHPFSSMVLARRQERRRYADRSTQYPLRSVRALSPRRSSPSSFVLQRPPLASSSARPSPLLSYPRGAALADICCYRSARRRVSALGSPHSMQMMGSCVMRRRCAHCSATIVTTEALCRKLAEHPHRTAAVQAAPPVLSMRQAAQSATVCCDCVRVLRPSDTVTMVARNLGRAPAPNWRFVALCLLCTLGPAIPPAPCGEPCERRGVGAHPPECACVHYPLQAHHRPERAGVG